MLSRPFSVLIVMAAVALPSIALSQGAARNVWSGVHTKAQADRGATAYAQHCASCHGDSLAGGDQAPPLSGATFLGNWNGQKASALLSRIRNTMPLDNPGSLSAATVTDIEAMIFAANGMPAGEAELPADAVGQAAVTITQAKPAG